MKLEKIYKILILTIAIFFVAIVPTQAAITQITDNSYSDQYPEVDKENIIWTGWDGNDNEIYMYNTVSKITTKITNNADNDGAPHINEGIITWSGDSPDGPDTDIYMYNITSGVTTRIINNVHYDYAPRTDGKYITWYNGEGFMNGNISLYNIESGDITQITNDVYPFNDMVPQIDSGNVVWQGFDETDYEIYLYNIASGVKTKITNNNGNDEYPKINDGTVVWYGYPGNSVNSGAEIYTYNIVSGGITRITYNDFMDVYPQINDGNIVWRGDESNQDFEIYLYNIASGTTTRITDDNLIDMDPQVDANSVVWSGWTKSANDIYIYDIASGEKINIDKEYEDSEPKIDAGTVTWYGWDGNDYEIYIQDGPCHCIELDVQPITTKSKGSYTNITANVTLGGPDSDGTIRSADIEIDIDWIINMLCTGAKGPCSATITPTITSDLKIGNTGTTQTSQSNTPASMICNGKCDTIVHPTQNSGNGHTKSTITVHRNSGGQANDKSISGTITVTMNSDCPIKNKTTTIHISGTVTESKSPANVNGVHTK